MSSASVKGFVIEIVDGMADVPAYLVDDLRSHGFSIADKVAEAIEITGSRSALIRRFVDEARRFAEIVDSAHLIAFAHFASENNVEAVDKIWHAFVNALWEASAKAVEEAGSKATLPPVEKPPETEPTKKAGK